MPTPPAEGRTSRLAPSPTGALHLGNARTFLVNWCLARQRGWRLCVRIEDLDGPRVKPGAEESALADLAWIGVTHDGPVLRQSEDLEPYRAALRTLAAQHLVYACALTRRDIEAALPAPHAGDHELPFPAALRPPGAGEADIGALDANYRLIVAPEDVVIEDAIAGRRTFRPADEVGDFVVWTRRGVPAYQLAVVVDDARQGVTDVVRGDDLLPSAARQTLLYRALGASPPAWWHVPLVVGRDGRRLAKRHGDTRLATFRAAGVTAERVVGLLAWWCGASPRREELGAAEFCARFDADTLPRSPVTFTEDDERWLLGA